MEEAAIYPETHASMNWAHDTLGKLLKVLDEDMNINYTLTRERMQTLFLDVVNIETEKLRNDIRKEFYGSVNNKGVKDVIITVCKYYGCQPEDIETRSRKREFLEPRQLVCWMIRNRIVPNRLTYEQIAAFVGGYNHATVLHSVKMVDQRIETETPFRNDIMKMLNDFGYRCSFDDGVLKWQVVE